ncbi:MAG: NAD-dependent epimerase/dehydratase family protein [Solirubrobacterales bacterium]|nr:NAD-dependent epimerase/dehydratase family protein [Solirubrobacterales bacterium]
MHGIVLVTGGSGFIGSHVVDRLAAAGFRPRIFDCKRSPWHENVDTLIGDLRRAEDVARAVRGCTAICHLGAAADVGEVLNHPAWATDLNTTGTLNVLEAARQAGIKRVVYASTVWVYSDVQADVVDEETLLPPPAHLYTAGKLSGELMCRSYAELYGLEPTILRFGIPYGPRARPAAVIPQFVDRALRGEPLTIAGTGEQQRAFVYVEDLAGGVVSGLAPQAAGRTYNLSGDETTTIRGLADIVCDVVAPVEIRHTEGRAGDLEGAVVRNQRAADELGWSATTSLRDGIRSYAEWRRGEATAVTPPQEHTSPARRRRPYARLAALATTDPLVVAAASVIAIISATIATFLGAPDTDQRVNAILVGICVLLPLLPLVLVSWPGDRRRFQAAAAAAMATTGVVILGVVSSDGDIHFGARQILLMLFASASATSAGPALARR